MYNVKSRHTRHRYNTIKLLLSNEIISIDYVKSKKNITNLLTKCLSIELVYNSFREMSLKPLKYERV
jgi:hypothetical protein